MDTDIQEEKVKIGVITIGQSPRNDIMEDIRGILGAKFEIIEKGALDSFDYNEVQNNFYPHPDSTVLVSRMRDGRQVKLAEEKIIPLLQECIQNLEERHCKAILMLCTGPFPKFSHDVLLIKPQEMFHNITQKLSDGNKVGVIVPDKDQVEMIKYWWNHHGVEIEVQVASPYEEGNNIIKAAEGFRDKDISLIFMDCMGYSVKMKQDVHRTSGKPVLLPRTLAARIINELFS
ncbi:AroM family protein [Natronincola ferrireducens]|uniref:Protein AroM n=1 Tax=Natronincola ferrireducens TaxID=393762 RepID=A0A1G9E506_9FIRM|nr:AroM family protein [Natronincola ferrireducens]SDK71241.1 protein AroM [Natronincola ferrireducens]